MSDDLNTGYTTGAQRPNDDRKKNKNGLKVLGFNLLALVIYTIVCKTTNDIGSLMLDAFLVIVQVVICLIVSAAQRDIVWLLSAFMVLAIGFSTCVYAGDLRI